MTTTNQQIIFNTVSSAEISALNTLEQLDILNEFNVLTDNYIEENPEKFRVLVKDNRKICCYRAKDFRIYFEKTEKGVLIHRVLHKNSLKDFFYRSNIEISEDEALQSNPSFWAMIDEASDSKKSESKE
jgi:hypothetical protein